MAITVTEHQESRDYGGGRGTLKYTIQGTSDATAAYAEIWSAAPATFGILVKRSARVEPIRIDTNDESWCYFYGEVTYFLRSIPETSDSMYQFETGSGNQHIINSLLTVNSYAEAGKTAPNFGKLIGVTDRVEGVDINVPAYSWSETYYKTNTDVTQAYKVILANLTWTVNDNTFRGFPAGEVLFTGASGQYRGGSLNDWEIAYRFMRSPNQTGLQIGDITGIAKWGWEYLWVRYKDKEETISGTEVYLKKVPASVHIEKVYKTAAFSGLDIG